MLSGDLLENVVEGPEGDVIYELYVPNEEAPPGGLREMGIRYRWTRTCIRRWTWMKDDLPIKDWATCFSSLY